MPPRRMPEAQRRQAEEARRNRNAERLRERRREPDVRDNERARDRQARQVVRQHPDVRDEERVRDRQARRVVRQDPVVRDEEQVRNRQARQVVRQHPDVRDEERVRDRQARRVVRQDPVVRDEEQVRDRQARRVVRQDPVVRDEEQVRDRQARQVVRQHPDVRDEERVRDRQARRVVRQDPVVRDEEQVRDRQARRVVRQNPDIRNRERVNDAEARQIARAANPVEKYLETIKEGPTNICGCCGGLFFSRSMSKLCTNNLPNRVTLDFIRLAFPMRETNQVEHPVCTTCRSYIIKGNLPKLCMRVVIFPTVPQELKDLTPLEARMVSLRIPFMNIRPLGVDRQFGIKGNIVNVPIQVSTSINILPRQFNDMFTIQVKLMRQMRNQRAYIYETIRPNKVFEAARFLVNTRLYAAEEINLDANWMSQHSGVTENFIVEELDREEQPMLIEAPQDENFIVEEHDREEQPMLIEAPQDENFIVEEQDREEQPMLIEAPQGEEEWDEEINDAPINPGLHDTLLLNDDDFFAQEQRAIRYAPGEGQRPIPLLLDNDAEFKSFPKTYCGEGIFIPHKVTYGALSKFEIRHNDRRACQPDQLLYKMAKLQTTQVSNQINICLRKRTRQGPVTAGNLLNNQFVEDLVMHDDGYKMLKSIRSSPAFWEVKKKDLMAMLRQLGCPVFFLTLSAAESRWADLLISLKKTVDQEDITEAQVAAMTYNEKADLIQKDPVTCARYFEHRAKAMFTLIGSVGSPFSPHSLTDSYIRTEFQHRGSPHDHCLLWLEGVPKYDKNNPLSIQACVEFIDKFITCSKTGAPPELVALQTHKHTSSCRRVIKKKIGCRFGFPLPPMRTTMILERLSEEETTSAIKKQFSVISARLMDMSKSREEITLSFDEFLQSLAITEADYILAIRSSLKSTKVYLRRCPNEIRINAYNPNIIRLHQANMDLQFILDPYACVQYIVNYINKANRGMSKLLREVTEETRRGNKNPKERLRTIGSKFINASEVSAQEATYLILGMSVSKASRKVEYINTGPPQERVGIVRPQRELEELDPESTDVLAFNMLDYYKARPAELENCTLAEFHADYNYSKRSRNARRVPNNNSDDETDGGDGDNEREDDQEVQGENEITLQRHLGYLRKRTVSKVLRWRYYNEEQDPVNFYREQLMLFHPWRDEQTELINVNAQELFQEFQAQILDIKDRFCPGNIEQVIEEAFEEIQEQNRQEDEEEEEEERNVVVRGGEEDNEEELENEYVVFNPPTSQNNVDIFHQMGLELERENARERFVSPGFVDYNEYIENLASLNIKQRRILLEVLHRSKISTDAYHIFIAGCAGVGKSRLIETLTQALLLYHNRRYGADAETMKILLCAPTGTAAFNIHGMTIHGAFSLPFMQSEGMPELSSDVANSIRSKLRQLKIIIIDEISMVGCKMLSRIDTRLRQVFKTTRPFGGIPVLVLGDLNQLRPVMDDYVFGDLDILAGNPLWDLFRIYQLTEIMRQRDDATFALALSNIPDGVMTPAQIQIFREREVVDPNQIPADALHLFRTNVAARDYNTMVCNSREGQFVQLRAKDHCHGSAPRDTMEQSLAQVGAQQNHTKTYGLPTNVRLQVGIRYMISVNVDTADGLVNSGTGYLRKIDFNRHRAIPKIIWMEFRDPIVGAKARAKYIDHMRSNQINERWTPIIPITRAILQRKRGGAYQIFRTQFPLVCAEGVTIYKSQGITCQSVAFHIPFGCQRAEMYVACSRVTNAAGLYLIGQFRAPGPRGVGDRVGAELQRLRTDAQMPFTLKFWEDFDLSLETFKVIYHNVENLNSHSASTFSDPTFAESDIVLLVETWSIAGETVTPPGFATLQRIDGQSRLAGRGSLVLVKEDLARRRTTISEIVKEGRSGAHSWRIEMCIFEIDGTTKIVSMYSSPRVPDTRLYQEIEDTIQLLPQGPLIFVGDFNVNVKDNPSHRLHAVMALHGLNCRLESTCSTTNEDTQIDLMFSSFPTQVNVYESATSYHKPIMFTI